MNKVRFLAILLLAVAVLSACVNNKKLTVGIEESLEPIGFVKDGRQQGFEVDLWEAVAKEAKLKYSLKPMSAGELIKAVEKGKVDVGLAGFTVTKERKKTIDFATPHYTAGLRILTLSKNKEIKAVKDLEDKTIATRVGTTGYLYASKIKGIKEVKAYPDIAKAYDALLRGEADAVIFDGPSVEHYMHAHSQGKTKIVGDVLTKEQYGIALKKGSPYLGRINNALRELGKNGTYERIYEKWFNEKPKSVPGEK